MVILVLLQKEVAEAVGLDRSNLSNYENDIALPSVDPLVSLASFYRCSLDYLILGKDQTDREKYLDVSLLDAVQARF